MSGNPALDAKAIQLLITLAYIPTFGLVMVSVIKWWIDQEIGPVAALSVMFSMILGMAVGILGGNEIVSGLILVLLVSLAVFFPYARDALSAIELKFIDVELLERAHARLSEKGENIGSVFVIARVVHALGLHGHAIRIAENAINSLSTEMDPLKFQSFRDLFRAEEMELKRWTAATPGPETFKPVKCIKCGFLNQAGTVACGRCKAPYLLEMARKTFAKRRATTRLLLGWAVIAGFLPFACWIGMTLPQYSVFAILAATAVLGLIMWLLFRPPQMRVRAGG